MLHDNEVINIEEDMILRPGCCIRRFTLNNRVNGLKIGITNIGATLISCMVNNGKDEIIKHIEFNESSANNTNQNNLLNIAFDWQSHVLGLDTVLLATNSHHNSTITYQLTTDNRLLMLGKLRSVNHLANLTPFFFNLNTSGSSIDGHFLHIKAINKECLDYTLSYNFIGNSNHNHDFNFSDSLPGRINWSSLDYQVYDIVYTLNGNYKEASLIATLAYGSKKIEITLQNSLNNLNIVTNNSQSINLSNTQNNLCKFKVKLSETGISIMPYMMTEFKCIYKFSF